jgi:hypothetical protein
MSTPQEATVANTDLWAKYFNDQWGRWLNPLGVPAASPVASIAAGTAAQVAGFLSLVAAGPIAWLYNTADADVMQITDEGSRELPFRLEPAEAESVEDHAAA